MVEPLILDILSSGRNVNAKELAGRLEVSIRTIYRDLAAMCDAGITLQITRGVGGGVKVIGDTTEEDYNKIIKIMDKPIKHSGKVYVVKTDTWLSRLLNEDISNRVNLVAQIDQSMSFRVYDELDGYWEKIDNGDLLIKIDVANTEWMYSYICSYCDKIRVISPASVREEVKLRYAIAYRRYQ